MTENNKKDFEARAPDYSGDGIAVWKATDKNGKEYLKISRPEWKRSLNCFKVELKKE